MPIVPYLQLFRKRLLWAAGLSLVFALLMLFITSAENLTDFGILWHHFCGCPPQTSDVYCILFVPTVTCLTVGMIMGVGIGTGFNTTAPGIATPGTAEMRFFFTRPSTRSFVLLAPALIATTAVAVFPAASMLLLLGWLDLVHAPALGHLVDIVRLIPSAANIGPHPSLLTVLRATPLARFYLSAVLLGLCAYALYATQRWWIRSPHTWLRILGAFGPVVVPMLPMLTIFSKRAGAMIMFSITTNKSVSSQPTYPLIALHFAFAALCLFSGWNIARNTEL